jgi:hypothetical protein
MAATSMYNRAVIFNWMMANEPQDCPCPRQPLLPPNDDDACVDCEELRLDEAHPSQPSQAGHYLLSEAHIVDPDETISYVSDDEEKYSETTIDDPLFRLNGVQQYYP